MSMDGFHLIEIGYVLIDRMWIFNPWIFCVSIALVSIGKVQSFGALIVFLLLYCAPVWLMLMDCQCSLLPI